MQWNETPTDKIPPTTETQAQLIGSWQWTVTFHEGPLQGQLERNRVFFAPDHTFLILLPFPGAGTWQSDVSDAISFSFTELLNYRADGTCTGYVMVTGRGSLSQDGTSFTASGQGVVYSADGTYLATNKTTAQGPPSVTTILRKKQVLRILPACGEIPARLHCRKGDS